MTVAQNDPAPAGWYRDLESPDPYTYRWWDGYHWTDARTRRGVPDPVTLHAIEVQAQRQQYLMAQQHLYAMQPHGRTIGLTRGETTIHIILTILTLGLWAPIWGLRVFFGRRRIH